MRSVACVTVFGLVLVVSTARQVRAGPLPACTFANVEGGRVLLCPPEQLVKQDDGRRVINGCGPESLMINTEKRFADEHTYTFEVAYGESYPYRVNFRDSCNLHDVGYQGRYLAAVDGQWVVPLVYDKILNQYVDYSSKSRAWVDAHFRDDMQAQCTQQISQQGPPSGRTRAIDYCKRNVCNASDGCSVGAGTMYRIVRQLGRSAFNYEDPSRVNDRGD